MKTKRFVAAIVCALGAVGILCLSPNDRANAHCDTLDGPVVKTARAALEKGDVTPVLKWVKPQDEQEIRHAFDQTLTVRRRPDSREFADRYFFETLVRVHRAGEGAPFTGLKPSGTKLEPGVAEADRAIASRSTESLIRYLDRKISESVRLRFDRVLAAREHSEESVEAGRRFVAAYVDFVHYVEQLYEAAGKDSQGHYTEHGAEPHGR